MLATLRHQQGTQTAISHALVGLRSDNSLECRTICPTSKFKTGTCTLTTDIVCTDCSSKFRNGGDGFTCGTCSTGFWKADDGDISANTMCGRMYHSLYSLFMLLRMCRLFDDKLRSHSVHADSADYLRNLCVSPQRWPQSGHVRYLFNQLLSVWRWRNHRC